MHDKAMFLKMRNSERLFLDEKRPSLTISSKENLLRMRNADKLIRESDKSTAHYKTLQLVGNGEYSYREMLETPEIFEYLPLIKVRDFAGAVFHISSNEAEQLLTNRGIYTCDRELGRLSLNEKTKLMDAMRGILND